LEILEGLESEFTIYKKNGNYMILWQIGVSYILFLGACRPSLGRGHASAVCVYICAGGDFRLW
jgi:hypothetical protein